MPIAKTLLGRFEVLAFEPVPKTAERLAAGVACNKLTNVRVYVSALGDTNGEQTFYIAEGYSDVSSHTAYSLGIPLNWSEIQINCCTLDSMLRAGCIPKVGMMKIDVDRKSVV